MSGTERFITSDGLAIAFYEWGDDRSLPPVVLAVRPQVLVEALPDATLTLVGGGHMQALTDPRFAATLVEFVA